MPRICYSPGNLTTDDYITVAGISSCEASGTDIVNVILPASADDLAKPTGLVAPSVSDDGSTIAPSSPLHASWSSSDYGISRYRYKITSMDSQQQEAVVLDWTETTSTEAAYTGTLTVGLSYYFHVESKTSTSDWGPEGTSDGIACRNVVFVKTGCSGAGTSWTDAFGTVEAGLSTVAAGGEVWVAQGIYTVPATPKTFTLGSGAGLYGGFAGTEAAREQRSPREHETILDGNKLGSVVTIPANATADTIIDGFTIRNGTGTLVSGSNYYGGGIYCPELVPAVVESCR